MMRGLTARQRASMAVGALLVVVGVVVALLPLDGRVRTPAGVRTFDCGSAVQAAGLADRRVALAGLAAIQRQPAASSAPADPAAIARVQRLVDDVDRYLACHRRGTKRFVKAGTVMLLGLASALIGLIVFRRKEDAPPAERTGTGVPQPAGR